MARRRRWLMIGLALALLGALALALLGGRATASSGLADAQRRWQAAPLADYQLSLSHQSVAGTCEQEIRVADGAVAEAPRNTCGQPAGWTVPRLFSWIAELESSPLRCYPGPAFCACQAQARTLVIYDEQLGYPRQIIYEWRVQPNLMSSAYWRSRFDQAFPGCVSRVAGVANEPLVVNVFLEE